MPWLSVAAIKPACWGAGWRWGPETCCAHLQWRAQAPAHRRHCLSPGSDPGHHCWAPWRDAVHSCLSVSSMDLGKPHPSGDMSSQERKSPLQEQDNIDNVLILQKRVSKAKQQNQQVFHARPHSLLVH